MKYLVCLVLLVAMVGCASGPTLLMVKNCKALGSNLYSCEEIPTQDVNGGTKQHP